jgi:hypothetical protein
MVAGRHGKTFGGNSVVNKPIQNVESKMQNESRSLALSINHLALIIATGLVRTSPALPNRLLETKQISKP